MPKLRKNETLDVILKSSEQNKFAPRRQQPAPGIIHEELQDNYVPRPLPSDIYLNFWDIGQFTEDEGETWIEFDWTVVKDFDIDGGGYVLSLDPLTITDWEALSDQVISVGVENFKNLFRKFEYEKAERYGVDVYLGQITGFSGTQGIDDTKYFGVGRDGSRPYIQIAKSGTLISDTKWTDKGLLIEEKQETQGFNLFTQNGFPVLLHSSSFGKLYKITEEPEYSADEVEFLIDASTDFFLMPMFVIEGAVATRSGNNFILNTFYAPLWRDFFIDGDGWNPADYDYSPFVTRFIDYVDPATPRSDALINYMKGRIDARGYEEPTGATSPAGFPLSGEEIDVFLRGGIGLSTSIDSYAKVVEGSLLAIAKKKNKWYYFWSNIERPNFHGNVGFSGAIPTFRMLID